MTVTIAAGALLAALRGRRIDRKAAARHDAERGDDETAEAQARERDSRFGVDHGGEMVLDQDVLPEKPRG